MRLPGRNTSIYAVALVVFLVVFAFLLLTYTRRVDGRSMRPTFEEGDLVVIQPAGFSSVVVGDVIVYGPPCASNQLSVIHRVVDMRSGGFITRGDNSVTNQGTDQDLGIASSPIHEECLVGRVVFVIPYVELVASLPYGLNYAIALVIFLLIVAMELNARRGKADLEVPEPALIPPAT